MSEPPSNYASVDDTFRVSAKRFARSPWLSSYITPECVLGVYSGRFFPLSTGEDPVEAYWHLRRRVTLFDVPEHPIEITGPDALPFLNRLFCRDLSRLRAGRATYAIACTHAGGIVMDGVVLHVSPGLYWYVLADGEFMTWLEANLAGYDVKVRDPGSWVLQVQGPRALEVLEPMLDGVAPEPFKYFSVHECEVAGEPFIVSRTGWTGELGFELYSRRPDVDGERVFRHLVQAGSVHGMRVSALECMGIRRIEAGIRDNGTDMDVTMTPFAAGLGRFVDLEKTVHIGAEALRAADRRSAFFGVRSDPGTPPGRHRVRHEGREVGRLTAAARSPFLQSTIGYVRFDSPGEWEGEQVSLEAADGTRYPARVVALPFYDAEKRIPRGLGGPPP